MNKKALIAIILTSAVMLSAGFFSALPVHAQPAWSVQTVDATAVRYGLSLALDPGGNPHLVYVDALNGRVGSDYDELIPNPEYLMYASWNGSGWNLQTVYGNPNLIWHGGVSYNALAIDSKGIPHIAYTGEVQPGSLNYATWTGNNWSIQTVDNGSGDGSIALDSAGNPHISYVGPNGTLKYASWNGLNWTIQTVDPSANLDSSFTLQSLALDSSGSPNIIYSPGDGSLVKWAAWNSTGWTIQTVTANVSSYTLGNVVVDSHGYPHFTYSANGSIIYDSWNGSAWNPQTVTFAGIFDGSFLTLDSSGNPVVTFTNSTFGNQEVCYARWTGENWDIQAVSQAGTLGEPAPVALDPMGNPYIAFYTYRDTGYEILDGTIMYATSIQPTPTPTPTPTQTQTPSPSIPEFPTWIALPSIFLATAFAAVVVARLKKQTGWHL
jgi:hypothetical protein